MLTCKPSGMIIWVVLCGHVPAQITHAVSNQTEAQNAGAKLSYQSDIEVFQAFGVDTRKAIVKRNRESGIVTELRGTVAVPGAKTPSEAAQLFLKKYKRLFTNTPRLDEFVKIQGSKTLTGTSLSFGRHHAGLPVIDDQLSVFVNKGLNIVQIASNFKPIKIPLESRQPFPIGKASAVQTALTAISVQTSPVQQPVAILSVAVMNEVAVAVWKVTFKTREPAASWQVLVDAKSGQVLAKRNIALFQSK